MFKKSIRRTSPKHLQNSQTPFFIRRYERVFGPEAAYVESFCANLRESRFGAGRRMPVIVVLSDRPELEPAVFYDMAGDDFVPCYTMSPFGRKGYQVMEAAYRKAKEVALLNTKPNAHNSTDALTPNHGRGSP